MAMENILRGSRRTMEKQFETMEVSQARSMERAGRAGVFLSIACAIHCLAAPFFLAIAPMAGLGVFMGVDFHLIMIAIVLVIAVACSCWGFHVHRKKRLVVAFAAAAAFVVLGHTVADKLLESILVFLGGFGLVASHFLNVYLCRTCAACEHSKAAREG